MSAERIEVSETRAASSEPAQVDQKSKTYQSQVEQKSEESGCGYCGQKPCACHLYRVRNL